MGSFIKSTITGSNKNVIYDIKVIEDEERERDIDKGIE